ncbi:hypothetical protein A6V39_03660 [Candidatus Mycoplasma haematobovis]|uniref:Uncharacterized protein n=1 Tax=Candidatus Mycoplasma haematobovis TaxID=432608 RepID=A0A1A9QBZ6_9MOLU|nr:hypothetical protein [Candidatus Mycoplasma haematobovis]OAL09983.1 hypothetical protein A6V39_03660 [Candidatus Mycoplasma haematobovis]
MAGLAGAGVIGGGTFYYFQTRDISISKQIANEGRTILDQHDIFGGWEVKLSTYQREKEKLSIKLDKEDIATLKSTYETRLADNFDKENTKLRDDLRKICARPTNKERFLKENKNLAGEGYWDQKVSNYASENIHTIPGISKTEVNKDKIKNWCGQEVNKEYQNEDEYATALKWCAK